jgi:hypothetical protein
MQKLHYLFFCSILIGCGPCHVKEKINKASEKAGETAGEVVKGVSRGLENSFEIIIDKSQAPRLADIELGKINLESSSDGSDNKLGVYMIFKKGFSGDITVKVMDNKGLEMGRNTQKVQGKANEAKFVDFIFDKQTNIDSDSKIVME